MNVVPYTERKESKKEQVAEMFNNISHRYDLLNHLLSFGIDVTWRKNAIRKLRNKKITHVLDVATGTADLAIQALTLNPEHVTGIDISQGMLDIGKEKIKAKKLDHKISLQLADSENLPFANATFDACTVAFGVRNFENLQKGLQEMHRVLAPHGTAVILEFSKPVVFPVKQLYHIYFKYICPLIGKGISKDSHAYTYLYNSVNAFPEGEKFITELKMAGFSAAKIHPLMFGIASIYVAEK